MSDPSILVHVSGLKDAETRGVMLRLKPEIELIQNDEHWTYNLITEQGTRSVDFKSGQIVDYVSLIGRPVKVPSLYFYPWSLACSVSK